MYRIGFIGLGIVSQICHLPSFEENKKVKITSLCDINKKLLIQVSKKYKDVKTYKYYKEMLDNENLDAVILSCDRFKTYEIANYILKKKVNLFSEKPQALTSKKASYLIDMANKNKVNYHVGYMKRFDNCIIYLKKKIIDKKKYGKLQNMYIENFTGDSYGNPYEYVKQKFKKRKQNIFLKYLNNFCHNINLIRYLVGEVEYQDKLSKNLKLNGEGILKLKSNNIDIILNTRFTKSKIWHETYHLNFEQAKIEVKMPIPLRKNESGNIKIFVFKSGDILKPFIKHGWSFRNQANYFVEVLGKRKDDINTSAKNSLKDIQIIEKIFR